MKKSPKHIETLLDSNISTNQPFQKLASKAMKAQDIKCNFKQLIDIIQDGIWITNSKDTICCSNEAMSLIAGIPSEQIIGNNIYKDFPKQTIENLIPLYEKAKLSKKPQWYDITVITPSNKQSYQTGWLVPQFENGIYLGMLCTVHDNSEEKTSKLVLAKSEKQYRHLVESLSQGLGYYEPNGRVIFFNKVAAKNMGGKPEDFVGKSFTELYGEEAGKVYLNRLKAACKTDEVLEYVDEVNLPNGHFWFKSLYSRILDENNDISGIQVISSDITKNKETEKKLTFLNSTLNAAQEMAKVGYWSFDIKTQIPSWSDQMFIVCGYKKENGVPNYEDHKLTWHPDDWDMFDKAVQACGKGTPYNIIVRIYFPSDKSYHYVNTQGFPKYDENGNIYELFGTSQDITDIKLAEEKIIKSEIKYETLINKMMNAFALHEMIYNKNGKGIDYKFLEVNPAWEKIVGMKAKDVIGKTIKEIMPNIESSWIEVYNRVVKTGISEEFINHNKATNKCSV